MQDLNDNMDELFRSAAEHYTLKLKEDDWDTIADKLAATNVITPIINSKKRKKNNYKLIILALLFLITSGTILSLILSDSSKNPVHNIASTRGIKIKSVNNMIPATNQKTNNNASAFNALTDITKTTILASELLIKNRNNRIANSEIKISIGMADAVDNTETSVSRMEQFTNGKIPENDTAALPHSNNSIAETTKKIVKTEEKVKEKTAKVTEKKGNQNSNKKDKRFYAGIFAGPQFSQVKSQGFSKSGFSAGLLAGVNITKKLAIETGVIISEKKYFSSGQYFNMKNIAASMPAGMEVISLNGKSTVVEIPVKIKYNFLKKNKRNFFGTAGLSSYILTKESNNYLAIVNGSQQKLTGSYSNDGNYYNAAVNISAGYEYKTKKATIRLEPYIQIPLKGIGVGSMPVLSTGVHVGIVLPFH